MYYLMHGAGGDETDWFSMNIDGAAANGEGDFVMLLDYLIANGLMEPFIFVSVTTNVDRTQLNEDINRKFNTGYEISDLIIELEKDLIPTVEGQFASYLNGTSYDAIVASREHRAFGGLSMGAYVVWNAMASTIDTIAYYAPLSNGASWDTEESEATIDAIYAQMREGENANLEIGFIFSQDGVKDHTWDQYMRTTNELYAVGQGGLVYGKNLYSFNPVNGTHTAKYFILGVYNSMQVFFK